MRERRGRRSLRERRLKKGEREQDGETVQVRQQSTSEFDEEWRSVRHLANEWSRHRIQGNNDVSEDCEGKKTVDR